MAHRISLIDRRFSWKKLLGTRTQNEWFQYY